MPKKTPGVSPWDEFGMNDNKYHNSSETPSVRGCAKTSCAFLHTLVISFIF